MKDIFGTVGKVLGFIFAAAVIAFTSMLTLELAKRLIPDDIALQVMTLVLFDVAALVWFIQFITQAKGTLQWAIAGIGFLVGLAGAIIMAGGELVLGQELVIIDDPTRIGWVLVGTVVIAALAHASLVYAFHFADPATKNAIENAQQVSKAMEDAYKDARSDIARQREELTASLRASILYQAQQQIAGQTAAHIRDAARLEAQAGETLRGGLVIPGAARDTGPVMTVSTPTPTQARRRPARFPWRPGKNGNGKKARQEDEEDERDALFNELLQELTALRLAVTSGQTGGGYAADTILEDDAHPNGRSG